MQQNNKDENSQKSIANKEKYKQGIVIPPGCDSPMLYECGEPVYTFTPESYKPYSVQENYSPAVPHMMSKKTGGISIPKCKSQAAYKSMSEYIRQFQGAYVCLDLWSNNRMKIKKCGFLLEVGEDFLVIREQNSSNINLIDLKPIRYISIYCK